MTKVECKVEKGSPPPMRGKAIQPLSQRVRPRITPAYAGKRRYFLSLPAYRRDHPRLCGEKLPKNVYRARNVRITPAYAGKSTQILWNCFFDQDHPRLCGEKALTQ